MEIRVVHAFIYLIQAILELIKLLEDIIWKKKKRGGDSRISLCWVIKLENYLQRFKSCSFFHAWKVLCDSHFEHFLRFSLFPEQKAENEIEINWFRKLLLSLDQYWKLLLWWITVYYWNTTMIEQFSLYWNSFNPCYICYHCALL